MFDGPERHSTEIQVVVPTGFQNKYKKSNLRQQTNVQKTTKPASGVFLLMFYYYHFISRLALIYLRKSSMDDKHIRLFDVDFLQSLLPKTSG